MNRKTASRIICGTLAFSFVGTAVLAACNSGKSSSENSSTSYVQSGGTSAESSSTSLSDWLPEYATGATPVEAGTSTRTTSEAATSPTYYEGKELEVKGAVDNAMSAYLHGDIDGILKYSTMEIMYYMAYRQRADKDTMKKAIEESGEDYFQALQENDVKWNVIEVAPLSDERFSDMSNFLYNEYDKIYSNDLPTYEEIKNALNISDVYVAVVEADYSGASEKIKEGMKNGLSSTSNFYVFCVDGEWQLDTTYSTSYSMQKVLKEKRDVIISPTDASIEDSTEGYTIERRESPDE